MSDHCKFLGNCLLTPPLSQHFVLSEKYVLMLALWRVRWAVSQNPKKAYRTESRKLEMEKYLH